MIAVNGLWRRYIHFAVLVLGLPVAILAAVMPANEYGVFDASIVDCDGLFAVMMFAIPALIFYGVNGICAAWQHRRGDRWHLGIAAMSFAVCLSIVPNMVNAVRDQARPDLSEACA